MRQQKLPAGWVRGTLIAASALATAVVLGPLGVAPDATAARPTGGGTVLQTNLVSDLPGAADLTDPNLVNPWGISESAGSPFWFSDNNSGLSTLYQVPGTGGTPVTINPLAVNIPTPPPDRRYANRDRIQQRFSGRSLPDHGPGQDRAEHDRAGRVPVRERGRDHHRLESGH